MVLTEQMVIIFFKLLNFIVLLGLLLYISMVYVLPALKKQLVSYREYLEGLNLSHRALQKDTRLVKKGMSDDEQQQEQLKELVKQWQSAVNKQRNAIVHERDERKKILEKSFAEHRKQMALYRTYKQVMPDSIEQARQKLIKEFAHNAVQQQFIRKVIGDLRKQ